MFLIHIIYWRREEWRYARFFLFTAWSLCTPTGNCVPSSVYTYNVCIMLVLCFSVCPFWQIFSDMRCCCSSAASRRAPIPRFARAHRPIMTMMVCSSSVNARLCQSLYIMIPVYTFVCYPDLIGTMIFVLEGSRSEPYILLDDYEYMARAHKEERMSVCLFKPVEMLII